MPILLHLLQMAFDAGLSSWDFENDGKVDELIAMMDEQFELVMIAEHMEESIVLMADLMNWPLKQVAFISLNARPSNSTHRTPLSAEQKQILRTVNSADVRIYEHFKAKFELRIEEFGRGEMARRVDALKAYNRQLTEQCIKSVIPPEETPGSPDYPVFTYEINENAPEICELITMEELKFTQLLKETQLRRFNKFEDYGGHEFMPPVN